MNKKDLQNKLKQENFNINIEMSEKVKNTRILTREVYGFERFEKFSNKNNAFKFTVFFACFVFFALCISGLFVKNFGGDQTVGLTSYIFEINPSICITTDKNNSVINICALNDDANSIVSDESVKNFKNLNFDECIERLMGVIKRKGFFDDFDKNEKSIKLYAFNDSNETQYKNLKHFEQVMRNKMDEFGYRDIPFEKHRIGMDDFKQIMGFEEEFESLDDMKDYFKQKNIMYPVPSHEL